MALVDLLALSSLRILPRSSFLVFFNYLKALSELYESEKMTVLSWVFDSAVSGFINSKKFGNKYRCMIRQSEI